MSRMKLVGGTLRAESRKAKRLEAEKRKAANALAMASRDRGSRLKAAKLLIPTLRLKKTDEVLAVSLAVALKEQYWQLCPVHDAGGPRILLLTLVEKIANLAQRLKTIGEPVKKVARRQLNSVRAQAKALAASLRDLPADAHQTIASHSHLWCIDDCDEDFFQKLQRLTQEAERWLCGEERQWALRAKEMKARLEGDIAFSLALHGVPLTCDDDGPLSEVLRAGYDHLGIEAGTHTYRTARTLTRRWSESEVLKRAKGDREASEIRAWTKRLSREAEDLATMYSSLYDSPEETPSPPAWALFGHVVPAFKPRPNLALAFLRTLLADTAEAEWPSLRRAWKGFLDTHSEVLLRGLLKPTGLGYEFGKFETTWRAQGLAGRGRRATSGRQDQGR